MMELGSAGRQAVVCWASKGFACAAALVAESVSVTVNARRSASLDAAVRRLRELNHVVRVSGVPGDISRPEVQCAVLECCPATDILVTNAGGPPAGHDSGWDRERWLRAIDVNMLTPVALIHAVLADMVERRFGRIINITSGSIKAPRQMLGLSNGARGGLTAYVSGLAKRGDIAGQNVTINNLLPGAFFTERLANVMTGGLLTAGNHRKVWFLSV